MDINTNGYVTPCELQSALGAVGLNMTDSQIDALVERYGKPRHRITPPRHQ